MTLDAVGTRYGKTPWDLLRLPPKALYLILGVCYFARGQEAEDEWWRKMKSGGFNARPAP